MKRQYSIAALAIGVCLSVSSTLAVASTVKSATKSEAISACQEAERARVASAEVKMEWTTTRGLIKQGEAALKRGDFKQAAHACKKAIFQGNASVKQATIEAQAWRARVPQ